METKTFFPLYQDYLEKLRNLETEYPEINNDLTISIFQNKYFLENESHPYHVYQRVAAAICAIDPKGREYLLELYNYLKETYFIPGGRILAGAGDFNRRKTLANCYVLKIKDDSIESIYETAKKMARTYSYGGGVGVDISVLRPAGAIVHNSAKHSTGAVSFMELYSLTTGLIGQQGRRGALMITINVKHPDIFLFILAKSNPNWLTEDTVNKIAMDIPIDENMKKVLLKRIAENYQVRFANISIKFTDEFFQALEEQERYPGKILVYKIKKYDDKDYTQDYEKIHYSENYPEKNLENYELVKVIDSPLFSDFYDIDKRDLFGDYVKDGYAYREAGDFMLYFRSREVGEIKKLIKARDIWNLFIKSNYNTAEPGLIFWSHMKRYSNSDYVGKPIISTNPCSEVPLEDGGACNLASINLARMVKNPFTNEATVDWELLDNTIKHLVRFMDNVIEWNILLHPLEEQRIAGKETRRIGIGILGMADMFIQLGIKYDSEEAIKLLDKVLSFIANRTYYYSAMLAKERGPFPAYSDEIFNSPFIKQLDKEVKNAIKQYGLRNVALLSIAPTGTISNIAITYKNGKTYYGASGGIEPIFALYYTRYSESFKRSFKVFHSTVQAYLDFYRLDQNVELPSYFVTAHDIDPEMRVKIQGVAQKWIDHAISSTINLPEDVDPEVISDIYRLAWKNGLKGITIYREGSRYGILSTGKVSDFQKYKNNIYEVEIDGKTIKVRGDEIFEYNGKLLTVYHILKKNLSYPIVYLNGVVQNNLSKISEKRSESPFHKCPVCGNYTLKIENGCTACISCGYGKCDL